MVFVQVLKKQLKNPDKKTELSLITICRLIQQ